MTTIDSLTLPALYLAAALSFSAALAHYACIFLGAPAFRFLGAGEPIACMAERGHWYPPFIAFVIGSLLAIWAAYALSAAGILPRFPLIKLVLSLATAIYLFRAIAFPLLKPAFPDNTPTFWLITSAISLVIGLAHLIGLVGIWRIL
jgi:hypothetical protein